MLESTCIIGSVESGVDGDTQGDCADMDMPYAPMICYLHNCTANDSGQLHHDILEAAEAIVAGAALDDYYERYARDTTQMLSIRDLRGGYDGLHYITSEQAATIRDTLGSVLSTGYAADDPRMCECALDNLRMNPLALTCIIGSFEEAGMALALYRQLVLMKFVDHDSLQLAEFPDNSTMQLPLEQLLFARHFIEPEDVSKGWLELAPAG